MRSGRILRKKRVRVADSRAVIVLVMAPSHQQVTQPRGFHSPGRGGPDKAKETHGLGMRRKCGSRPASGSGMIALRDLATGRRIAAAGRRPGMAEHLREGGW